MLFAMSWGYFFLNFVFLASLFLILLLVLVLVFVRWVEVEESTCAEIMRGGAVDRIVLCKQGHVLDENYNLIVEPPGAKSAFWESRLGRYIAKLIGGRRFYIRWLERVYVYSWKWQKTVKGVVVDREEKDEYLTYVGFLYTYGATLEKTNTKDKVPIVVKILIVAKIINPYKALFEGEWYEAMINLIKPPSTEYVNSKTYDELTIVQGETRDRDEFQEDLRARTTKGLNGDEEETNLFEYLEKHVGVKVTKVALLPIEVTDEYRALLAQKLKGQMRAEEDAAAAATMIHQMQILTGMDVEAIKQMLASDQPLTPKQERIFDLAANILGAKITNAQSLHIVGGSDLERASSVFGYFGGRGSGGVSGGSPGTSGGSKSGGGSSSGKKGPTKSSSDDLADWDPDKE